MAIVNLSINVLIIGIFLIGTESVPQQSQIDDEDGFYHELPSSSTPEPVYPDGVNTIPGDALIHYPVYEKIFKTKFSCAGRIPGFYADIEARCQIWHICDVDHRMQSFLCTNGTIFSQATRVCEWWYNTNCEANQVQKNYAQNQDLYKIEDRQVAYEDQHLKAQAPIQGQRSQQILQAAPTRQPLSTSSNQRQGFQLITNVQPQPNLAHQPTIQRHSAQSTNQRPKFEEATNQRPRFEEATNQRPRFEAATNQRPRFEENNNQRPRFEENNNQRPRLEANNNPRPRFDVQTNQQRPFEEPTNQRRRFEEPAVYERPLSRDELEQRRQAARDEFYSIPARLQQENRVQGQQENPNPTLPSPPLTRFPPLANPIKKQPSTPQEVAPTTELSTIQKFRHSTPRKHNVKFKTSPESEHERQIPSETQQNGFQQYYNTRREFSNRQGLEFESSEVLKAQVKNAEIQSTTTTQVPRLRKRKRRPIKKAEKAVPLPNLEYKPPPIENPTTPEPFFQRRRPNAVNSVKEPKQELSRPVLPRVVIKRKLRKQFPKSDQKSNINEFPGNPHLEQAHLDVQSEFRLAHVPQKRCAVVGNNSSFKVFC